MMLSMLTTMPISDSDDTLDLAPADDGLGYAASITRRGNDSSIRWKAIRRRVSRRTHGRPFDWKART